MKRDPNLIRKILLEVEKQCPVGDIPTGDYKLEDYTPAEIGYHATLLIDADYIKAINVGSNSDPFAWIITRLTWEGCEFLDAARDDTVWKKSLERIAIVGGSVAIDVLKAVLSAVAKQQLGL